ncbi:MAG TPA: DUF2752 domain-containing protein [Chloroflexota bacterium]|nr:DUF2752 domain-containing protein [Chloroflexota bacterium]
MRPNSVSGLVGYFQHRATPGWLALGALIAAASVPPAWVQAGPVLSPFRLSTGLPDPSCGLTRSVVALAHGDLAGSLFFHPLGPAVAVALVALLLVDFNPWRAVLSKAHPQAARFRSATALLESLVRGPFLWGALAAFLLVWLVRLPLFLAGRWVY